MPQPHAMSSEQQGGDAFLNVKFVTAFFLILCSVYANAAREQLSSSNCVRNALRRSIYIQLTGCCFVMGLQFK